MFEYKTIYLIECGSSTLQPISTAAGIDDWIFQFRKLVAAVINYFSTYGGCKVNVEGKKEKKTTFIVS